MTYFDEGVQAPDGREFVVKEFPLGSVFPLLGRSPAASLLWHGQWTIEVSPWPRRRGTPKWSSVVDSEQEADETCNRIVALLERGEWHPGEGEPPAPLAT